jgi:hypothetical protein
MDGVNKWDVKETSTPYLGDRLGTLRDGVLRQFAREDQTNSSLDFP